MDEDLVKGNEIGSRKSSRMATEKNYDTMLYNSLI